MILNLLICALAIAAMAAANAVMDKVSFHFSRSVFAGKNALFWNPALSWRNKWKNGEPAQGEKFPGSSSVLVSVTDAWHLFKKLLTAAMAIIPAAWMYSQYRPEWYWILAVWVGAQVLFGAVFHLFFHYLLEAKGDEGSF